MSAFDRLKKVCDEKGLSINELEEKVGLGKNTLYSWKNNIPKGSNLVKVADYLQVSVDYLLGRKEIPYIEDEKATLQTWFRSENTDLTKEEQDVLLEELEEYLTFRKQRILKNRKD